jgi:hypothetical protein
VFGKVVRLLCCYLRAIVVPILILHICRLSFFAYKLSVMMIVPTTRVSPGNAERLSFTYEGAFYLLSLRVGDLPSPHAKLTLSRLMKKVLKPSFQVVTMHAEESSMCVLMKTMIVSSGHLIALLSPAPIPGVLRLMVRKSCLRFFWRETCNNRASLIFARDVRRANAYSD